MPPFPPAFNLLLSRSPLLPTQCRSTSSAITSYKFHRILYCRQVNLRPCFTSAGLNLQVLPISHSRYCGHSNLCS
ncbi:hypothetical protein B0H10DRAFT_2090453 [Mycena sp. CBHHK59/15]|nr:hypothetical protein B0H10DRAFT_2090453 [Mycena sp. CBHHK59/15]